MAPTDPPRFAGFSREAVELLRELQANNTRTWFAAHRKLFHELCIAPAIDLIVELGPLLHRHVSPDLRAEPRLGGSIRSMQIGARNSGDDPVSTYLELWFWPGQGPSHDHPGFFTRIGPDQLTVGAGIMLMPPHLLLRYREHVDQPGRGRELAGILRRLQSVGATVAGEQLRRVPKPFPLDHERADLLTHLGLHAMRVEQVPSATAEVLFGPVLPHLLVSAFVRLAPLWRWLVALED